MGLHTALQIYASCYELLGAAGDVVMNMRRDAKKLFGEKIVDCCIELDLCVRAANIATDKGPHLLRLLERLEVIELLTRVCRDRGFLSPGGYAKLVQHTQSIGRQANGWRNSNSGMGGEQPRLFPDR